MAALALLPNMDIRHDVDLREALTVMGMRGWRDHLIAWREFYPHRRLRHTGRLQSGHYEGPSDEPNVDRHTWSAEKKGKYAAGVDSGKRRDPKKDIVSDKAREVYRKILHPFRHRDGNFGVAAKSDSTKKLKKAQDHQLVWVRGDSDTVWVGV